MRSTVVLKKITFLLFVAIVAFGRTQAFAQDMPLTVLTFNTWLLRTLSISKDTNARLALMPELIAGTGADVVALQEAWSNRDRNALIRGLKKFGYPHAHFFPRNVRLGDGLLIVSKFPIAQEGRVKFPQYSWLTRPDEAMAKKRPIKVVIEISRDRKIDFFSTHLGAISFDPKLDRYLPDQFVRQGNQMKELIEAMLSSQENDAMILAADLNLHYQEYDRKGLFHPKFTAQYAGLVQQACKNGQRLENTFLKANQLDESSSFEATYDQKNPYVAKGAFATLPSEVEDYILACLGNTLEVEASRVVFQEPISKEICARYGIKKCPQRLSDHYGVLTRFRVR